MGCFEISDILGTLGGIFAAICLMPQIGLILKQKSAEDISYTWLFLNLIGLCLDGTYLILIDAFVGWVTVVVEVLNVLIILFLKIYYSDRRRLIDDDTKKPTSSRDALNQLGVSDGSDDSLSSSAAEDRSVVQSGSERNASDLTSKECTGMIHRGMHIMWDVVFVFKKDVTITNLSEFLLQEIQTLCEQSQVRILHKYVQVLPSNDRQEEHVDFALFCMMNHSRLSVRSCSSLNTFAFDHFSGESSGSNFIEPLRQSILSSPLFDYIKVRTRTMPRLLCRVVSTGSESPQL